MEGIAFGMRVIKYWVFKVFCKISVFFRTTENNGSNNFNNTNQQTLRYSDTIVHQCLIKSIFEFTMRKGNMQRTWLLNSVF
jgi:hypothetical protein